MPRRRSRHSPKDFLIKQDIGHECSKRLPAARRFSCRCAELRLLRRVNSPWVVPTDKILPPRRGSICFSPTVGYHPRLGSIHRSAVLFGVLRFHGFIHAFAFISPMSVLYHHSAVLFGLFAYRGLSPAAVLYHR